MLAFIGHDEEVAFLIGDSLGVGNAAQRYGSQQLAVSGQFGNLRRLVDHGKQGFALRMKSQPGCVVGDAFDRECVDGGSVILKIERRLLRIEACKAHGQEMVAQRKPAGIPRKR